MKKFLIATILVLSCSTASADDVYIQFRNRVGDSPEEDRAWRSLVSALDFNLRKAGHTSSKDYKKTHLGVLLMTATRGGGRPYVKGAQYCLVKDGGLKWMGIIPLNGSGFDADWMARMILQEVELD